MASVITLGIFVAWIAIEFVDVYIYGKFMTSTNVSLTEQINGLYPTYSIQQEDLFTTFNFVNYDGLTDLDQYVTGMWMQHTPHLADNKWYKSINCEEVFSEH